MEYEYYKSSVYVTPKVGSAHLTAKNKKLQRDVNDKGKKAKTKKVWQEYKGGKEERNTALVFAFALVFTTLSAVLASATIWYRSIAASEKSCVIRLMLTAKVQLCWILPHMQQS